MNFVYPALLTALAAIAIPIIIHLFNFRKFKKIYFTNVRFLQEVKHETQSRSRLKHLLVLCARIFAVAFLALAFSQPYIPADEKKQTNQNVSVFIDNSFSMDAVNDNGRLFEQAKQIAREIANAYQPTDKFQLLTNDFESRHQRLVNRDELMELIDETEISSSSKNISEIISRQKDAVKPGAFFIISDFQKSICDFNEVDTSVNVKLIPLQSQQRSNLYIDSCWFSSPVRKLNQSDELHIRIVNKSENNFENIPVKLTVNGQVRAIGTSFNIAANSQIDTALNFTLSSAGWQNAVVEITDYPLTFDDKFFLSFYIAENIHILCINSQDTNKYIQSLFGNDSFFVVQNFTLKNIDYSSFSKNNLLILSEHDSISSGMAQELKKFAENGGSLLIFPSENINFNSYKDFLSSMNMNYFSSEDTMKTKVSELNFNFYENVFDYEKKPENMDLPSVNKYFVITKNSQTNEESVLKMQSGNNFLCRNSFGKGFVYVCSAPLNSTNFAQHAIFVPTLYRIALTSRKSGKLYYTIGKDNSVEIEKSSGNENVFHIVAENLDFIPEYKIASGQINLFIHNQIKNAGIYLIKTGNEVTGNVAFNYDRKESDASVFSEEEISNLKFFSLIDAKIIGKKLGEISEGIRLWKYCIIFVLIFLSTEVALLKWWK